MDVSRLYLILYFILSIGKKCMLQNIQSPDFISEDEKVELRKTLDGVTQAQIVRDPENSFFHSYIFKSGAGNREGVNIDKIERDIQFQAGTGVMSWQSIYCEGQVFLLGYSHTSISLLVTSYHLFSNRSAVFSEHTLDTGAQVTSMTLLSRWNAVLFQEEVIIAVALNSSAADILWYRVVENRLVNITCWSHYKQTSSIAAIKGRVKDQLVVVDTGSPATVNVFDIIFTHNGSNLDLSLAQRITLTSECSSLTVSQAARQIYLIFVQPFHQSIAVYRQLTVAHTSSFENYSTLTFPKVSQVISFRLASQVYLAINGDSGIVLRLTDSGEFVEELSLGAVLRWLAVPVPSYRSDVVLFSQDVNNTSAFVWGGTVKGFIPTTMPKCNNCLEGDWSGAVSIHLRHRNCLLIPRAGNTSNLITIVTSLYSIDNPVKDQIVSMIQSMKQYEERLQTIQFELLKAEESLKHIIKVNGDNVVTAKWKLSKISTPQLILSSMVNQEAELNSSTESDGAIEVSSLESLVEETVRSTNSLQQEVLLKEKEVWGLEGYSGKLTVKGRLIVDNLTVSNLNGNSMDDILQNTYRRDKPKTIQGPTVIESFQVEDLYFGKVNKQWTSENIKFSDEPVVIKGNLTMLGPLRVDGKMIFEHRAQVNGFNLSQQLCNGEQHCAVYPKFDTELRTKRSAVSKKSMLSDISQHTWRNVIGGKNITVLKINDIKWETLTKNVVFTDNYQEIPGTTIVIGTVSSDKPVWVGTVEDDYSPRQRVPDKPLKKGVTPFKKSPATTDGKIKQDVQPIINPYSDIIFSELEVTGTITCDESEWGAAASDVILSDTDPIHIYGDKVFKSDVNVENNLEINGLVGGVNVSELLTKDTVQTFTDHTTLHGNVTLGNITVTGSLNGMNITSNEMFTIDAEFMTGVNARQVLVSDTLNGVPVTEFVYTDSNGVTTIDELIAQNLSVAGHLTVSGKEYNVDILLVYWRDRTSAILPFEDKYTNTRVVVTYTKKSHNHTNFQYHWHFLQVFNQDLKDYQERRLSIKEEQTISGNFIVNSVNVSRKFDVINLNGIEMSSIFHGTGVLPEIVLSALHVDGNITTDFGLNGYNLSQVAADAVMLLSNSIITGHLNFQDNVTFDWLECQGFFNQEDCQKSLDVSDVVFKTNETNLFSGKMKFLNSLNILEDVDVKQLNGNKVESILTKTTHQIIEGNVYLHGNVTVSENLDLEGFLNNQNLKDIGSRCVLSGDTIRCTGDATFEDSVNVDHFNCEESINGINFNHFANSLVDVQNPQTITGFKKFSGTTYIINLEVNEINENSWDDFLVNTVSQNGNEALESAVTFTEKVNAFSISVDFNLDADSINGVDLNEWKTNAIYLDKSFNLSRTLYLSSASSAGNLSIATYGNVNMGVDLIRLHTSSVISHLSFEAVTVLNCTTDIGSTVNGHDLYVEEQKTLKIHGDQVVASDVMLSGEVSVSGNLTVTGLVNHYNLFDVVTLDTDQILDGNYKFECMEVVRDVNSSGMMSTVNMSEWRETALLDRGQQEVSGTLIVLGDIELRGPVQGKGRLGNIHLAELKDNITREILDVHRNLKANLTSVCEKTNQEINQARNQTSKFLFLDLSQEILVPDEISLVTHFKDGDGDFLSISNKKCTTTIYKWDKFNNSYSRQFSKVLGYEVSQLVALQHNQLTYLVSVSSNLSMDCYFSDTHLWIFTEDSLKHVSVVELGPSTAIQAYNNRLYSMNSTGLFKWTMQQPTSEGVKFELEQMWTKSTDGQKFIPEDLYLGLATEITGLQSDFLLGSEIFNNCSGDILSVSVSKVHQLIAATTSEKAQVPKYSDHVKIYHLNGSLFDKIPAQRASHLHWFPVPDQTWLVFMQNHSLINLYHLHGNFEGFQQMFSARIQGIISLTSQALPMVSKVNRQPYLIAQTMSSVKVLQTFLEGDPYLKPNVPCSFDDALHTINSL